mgnify:CR=1 FL=1
MFIADGKPRVVGDIDVAHHPVVDIATEHHHTRAIKDYRRTWRALVQTQLKALGQGKGIDVMADIVAIRKRHRRTAAHRQYSGANCCER